ncbi:hypothetical protein D3C77_763480 [compost metagenome]
MFSVDCWIMAAILSLPELMAPPICWLVERMVPNVLLAVLSCGTIWVVTGMLLITSTG